MRKFYDYSNDNSRQSGHSAPQDGNLSTESYHMISALTSFVTPISQPSVRIHFNSTDDEAKGLEVLLENDFDVHCYDDNIYGVASSYQLRLLTEHHIKFKKILF